MDHRYPVSGDAAAFHCSDPALDRLFDVCRETLSACATDTLIDCPWREGALWVNDLITENVLWLRAFGDGRLNARCLRLALSDRRAVDGLLSGVCPCDGQDQYVLAPTNLFFPMILEEYVRFSGDLPLAAEAVTALHRVFDTVHGWHTGDGVIQTPSRYWNFVDWAYQFVGRELNGKRCSVVSWFHAHGLRAMVRLCERLGDAESAARYAVESQFVADATHQVFWDEAREQYREFPLAKTESEANPNAEQLIHALAYLYCATLDRMTQLASALDDESLFAPELYMQHFVLRALIASGQDEAAMRRARRYWLPITETAG